MEGLSNLQRNALDGGISEWSNLSSSQLAAKPSEHTEIPEHTMKRKGKLR